MEPKESPDPTNEPRKVPKPPPPESAPNNAATDNGELLSDRSAADFLGVSVRRLHQLRRRRGDVAASRVGWRHWRFRSADLMAYVQREAAASTATEPTDTPPPPSAPEPVSSDMADLQKVMAEMGPGRGDDDDGTAAQVMAEEAPVVRMANAILSTAIDNRASDIYIEPDRQNVRVRLRIDGSLQEIMTLPKYVQLPTINRYKVMADLDLFKPQITQTGHISVRHGDNNYDLRVTVLPTRFGETVSIRIFDQVLHKKSLDILGVTPDIAGMISYVLATAADSNGGGLFLIAGPSGAGLTATAFCLLNQINSFEQKIITVEQMREYEMPGVTQTYTNGRRGVTAANLQQAALRQQADVLFLGDLRTAETAALAVDAALSGVLTLATINANDAVDAVRRLGDLGIAPDKVSRALIGVVGQRLARRLCRECCEAVILTEAEWDALGFAAVGVNCPGAAYRAPGCEGCRQKGVQGRIGLFEFLEPNWEIGKLIALSAGRNDLRDAAKANRMRFLSDDAFTKAAAGVIAPEEARRAVGRAAHGVISSL